MAEPWPGAGVQIRVEARFGSLQSNHRQDLRDALALSLAGLGAQVPETLGDLGHVPRLVNGAVSISHCRLLGGWAYSASARRLGFDLELAVRARPELVLRQATPEEFAEAPNPVALWTAKEAAYKFLIGENQPLTAKEIQINNWRPCEEPAGYRFSARHDGQVFIGVSWPFDERVWASVCQDAKDENSY